MPVPYENQHETVPIHFDGAYSERNDANEKPQWELDAQIAARKAMSKRHSRSYTARMSRTKSRKRDIVTRPAKPTIDTSFTRHKGSLPRQVYPKESDARVRDSVRRPGWFGVSRSGTRSKGLGIMKGTPQPGGQPEDYITSPNQEPKTADTLMTPMTSGYMGISPSDRPIPIGISLPSDSLPDLSPYQTTRNRSESDATMVTPSIIITPAAAMKSVWSPDTESEYTPSVYSRGTFNPYAIRSDVPPVPALPQGFQASTTTISNSEKPQDAKVPPANRSRNGTLDSAGTAFEDVDLDWNRKDRIMSSTTVFEEDEIPLRGGNAHASVLSVDTSLVPTPRRSQGWWNYITTPFEFSRTNSVWTQGGRNVEKTPEIPMLPQRFGGVNDPPSARSSYIWSATEKSPSLKDSPLLPIAFSAAIKVSNMDKRQRSGSGEEQLEKKIDAPSVSTNTSNTAVASSVTVTNNITNHHLQKMEHTSDHDITSGSSVMSVPPVVGTAAIGTVLTAQQLSQEQQPPQPAQQSAQPAQPAQHQQPINVNIVFHDRRPDVEVHTVDVSRSVAQQTVPTPNLVPTAYQARNGDSPESKSGFSPPPPHFPPPPRQSTPISASSSSHKQTKNISNMGVSVKGNPYVFPPPPHFGQAHGQMGSIPNSRSSSPVASEFKKEKAPRQHRKVFNFAEWLRDPFGRRSGTKKKQTKEKGKSKSKSTSRRKKWCLCCCCCLLILILLAILLPILVVLTRKKSNNGGPAGTQSPIKWLNLTGYPPMPTGISTLAQPEAVEEETGCIAPATAWSCAVPKEDQQAIKPNKPDQPNLRFEIVFQNGTIADPSKTRPARRAANAVSAGAFIRSLLLGTRAAPSASPPAPNADHYKFLGETTDGNTGPFEGEDTPFFFSLLDNSSSSSSTPSRLLKRQSTNITSGIPPPQLNPDGSAAPANLLPHAQNQPVRLFNRGRDDEHYGFFVYYDRSIFLKEILRNFTRGGNPADQDGGSPKEAATFRCTWAQTRLLVQIWTRSQKQKPLLGAGGGASPNSPANSDLKRPGSFPYPVTVTLDRHGGTATEKMLYCYKMEVDGKIRDLGQNKQFLREDRGFGGNLVRPGGGPLQDGGGVIDGGSGGCRCQWQNWLA